MDENTRSIKKAVKILSENKSFLICIAENPSDDTIASSTSLYLALSKLGKDITLVCPTKVKSDLIGVEKIKDDISIKGNTTIISFPFKEGSIDKVDYYIQGDNFNIIIKPSSPKYKLDKKNIKFSSSGGKIDYVITIDVDTPRKLDYIYSENQDLFKTKKIINIDRHITNTYFGEVNFVKKSASSTSEIVIELLDNLKLKIDKDIATNLYFGLRAATRNFSSYSVTPETLENAAFLLKKGAVKKPLPIQQPNVFSKRQRSLESIEKENFSKEFTEDQELKPKIFRPTSSRNLS